MSQERQAPLTRRRAEPANRGSDETRLRILRAALELFSRDGFDATTVRAIARRCEISDAAVFYYFTSKQQLLDALWSFPSEDGFRRLKPGGPMTPARLRSLTDESLDVIADNHDLLRLMTGQALAGDRTASALREEARVVWRRMVHAHFAASADIETSETATDALHALITGITMRVVMEHGDDAPRICRDPEFRESLFRRALLVVPVAPPAAAAG